MDLRADTILEYQEKYILFEPFYTRTEVFWCPFDKKWVDYKDWDKQRDHCLSLVFKTIDGSFFGIKRQYLLYRMKKFYGAKRSLIDYNDKYPTIKEAKENTKRFSYGLSACGYDVRIAQDIWIWPLFGRLASTIERFKVPVHVNAKVMDKSSLARRFFQAHNTICEPGWEGYLTLELSSDRPWPRKIKKGTPIAQIVFTLLDGPTSMPYGKDAKYQNQPNRPVPAK